MRGVVLCFSSLPAAGAGGDDSDGDQPRARAIARAGRPGQATMIWRLARSRVSRSSPATPSAARAMEMRGSFEWRPGEWNVHVAVVNADAIFGSTTANQRDCPFPAAGSRGGGEKGARVSWCQRKFGPDDISGLV